MASPNKIMRHKFIFSFYLHLSFSIANIEYGLEICQVKGGYMTDYLVVTFNNSSLKISLA